MASGFRRLHHTMNKELRVWWDIATLEHYLAARMVPQRLRWDLQIYEGERTTESDLYWSSFFNECGLRLLEKLIERKRIKLRQIEGEIEGIEKELEPHKNEAQYNHLSTEVKNNIIRDDKIIMERKQKKLRRDEWDYRNKAVFKWLKEKTQQLKNPQMTVRDTGMSEDDNTWRNAQGSNIRKNHHHQFDPNMGGRRGSKTPQWAQQQINKEFGTDRREDGNLVTRNVGHQWRHPGRNTYYQQVQEQDDGYRDSNPRQEYPFHEGMRDPKGSGYGAQNPGTRNIGQSWRRKTTITHYNHQWGQNRQNIRDLAQLKGHQKRCASTSKNQSQEVMNKEAHRLEQGGHDPQVGENVDTMRRNQSPERMRGDQFPQGHQNKSLPSLIPYSNKRKKRDEEEGVEPDTKRIGLTN